MFSKRRQLLLTDFPRLLCVKETAAALKVKSEVILGMPSAPGSNDELNGDEARVMERGAGNPAGAGAAPASFRHRRGASLANTHAPESGPLMADEIVGTNPMAAVEGNSNSAAPLASNAAEQQAQAQARTMANRASIASITPNVLSDLEPKGSKAFVVHTVREIILDLGSLLESLLCLAVLGSMS